MGRERTYDKISIESSVLSGGDTITGFFRGELSGEGEGFEENFGEDESETRST
jgi:hypothetical protein